MTRPVPVLLDTDIGTDVDDALAIGLLLAAPEIDLRAVTIVSGDAVLRGRIAKKLLTLGGRTDVPVAAGVPEPVLRQRNFLWLGHEGQRIVAAHEALPLASAHGVDLLIDTVLRERPHVVAIGPLSNLAVAIMKEPAVIAAISHLTLMGGALGIHNDADVPLIEYNLNGDPEAALVVLSAGIPATLVPLDVTWHVRFKEAELARLRQSRSPLVQVLCDAMEVWWPIHREFFAGARSYTPDIVAFLHDPLAVAVLIDPSLVTRQRLRLRPAIVDGVFRLLAEPGAPEFTVATEVDAPRFVEFLVQRLLQLP
ncbi:MAG: nucleoside hydrolase [Deltaproteobacteria bacterium]|nr:nucleoside hydrolase [Deltaproteobacteria bacterium]